MALVDEIRISRDITHGQQFRVIYNFGCSFGQQLELYIILITDFENKILDYLVCARVACNPYLSLVDLPTLWLLHNKIDLELLTLLNNLYLKIIFSENKSG